MSFSHDTKAELCRLTPTNRCCAVAECYGILLYCNTFSPAEIKITTESQKLGQLLPGLFAKAFSVAFDICAQKSSKAKKLTFTVNDAQKLNRIFDAFGYDSATHISHHINLGVIEDDCCKQSFIRGAFLAGGSVTDPLKSYHLELVTGHYHVGREMYSLLLEMDFQPKEVERNGNFVTYFKQSTAIEELLTTIGAPISAMKLMSQKIEKDMRNSVNRKVNCDTANVSKTVEAAQKQIEIIQSLSENRGLDRLPQKLRETAVLRLENPELSIAELAAACTPPVTKSCLNHRLRKLSELAE